MKYLEIKIERRPFRGYLPDATERSFYGGKRPAVVIFPGGGYAFTYEGEAEPIALKFVSEGIPAFLLDYTCAETEGESAEAGVFPKPLREAFASIRFVRAHAREFGIDPGRIAACGFSAGGHLCACTGTLWNKPFAREWVGGDPAFSRPDRLILCYAVLRSRGETHPGSFLNLLGANAESDPRLPLLDAVENVDVFTPPSFLWTTSEDDAVPAAGSLRFAEKLAANRVPFALHVWRHGGHGLCLGNQVTQAHPFGADDEVSGWTAEAVKFLYDD